MGGQQAVQEDSGDRGDDESSAGAEVDEPRIGPAPEIPDAWQIVQAKAERWNDSRGVLSA